MTKLQNNKGFTLVELLIVIAIIAILAAVALPVYTAQIESARVSVDDGVVRSAASLAQSDYLLSGKTTSQTYTVWTDTVGSTNNVYVTTDASTKPDGAANAEEYTAVSARYTTDAGVASTIILTIDNGGQVTASNFTYDSENP